MSANKDSFEQRVKNGLDNSIEHLDINTREHLNTVRRQALHQATRAPWFNFRMWAPVTGLALCSLVALLIALPKQHTLTAPISDQTAMLELLENPEDLDTLTDPDFYLWVDEIQNLKTSYLGQKYAV